MRTQQSGFTLVEIAIVLVIIGLLLGGVLKGQELINSAKSKAVIGDFRNTATMIAAYQDRFRALPGDDKNVKTHMASADVAAPATAADLGNGAIDGAWNSAAQKDESVLFWQHVRLANLATGPTAAPAAAGVDAFVPHTAEGGRIGVQSTQPKGFTVGRLFVCQGSISGRVAQQIDTTMDDGVSNTGAVQVYANKTAEDDLSDDTPIVPPLVESEVYVVCASF
jgi:prepilin-type N-terminal cleavage/methylation domain-containing protein